MLGAGCSSALVRQRWRRVRCAGTLIPSLTTWLNNCSRLLSIISCIWRSPEIFKTSSLLTKWNHWSPSIWRWERVWKASRRQRSSRGNVQHSEPYRRMDMMQTSCQCTHYIPNNPLTPVIWTLHSPRLIKICSHRPRGPVLPLGCTYNLLP